MKERMITLYLLFGCYSGAFSKVYRAIQLDTQEKVAIKIVTKSELNQHQVITT